MKLAAAFAAATVAMVMSTSSAFAQQNTAANECGAGMLQIDKGKVTVVEDGKATDIAIKAPKTSKAKMAAARTTCRSSGGYTVCSNGRHGCVWSDRSGKLLGCGAGI